MKKLILPLLIILSFTCISIFAQAVPKSEPYKLGESLSYEGKFSKELNEQT